MYTYKNQYQAMLGKLGGSYSVSAEHIKSCICQNLVSWKIYELPNENKLAYSITHRTAISYREIDTEYDLEGNVSKW